MEVSIRRARLADLDRVRELTRTSKAHWGYEQDFVLRWAEGLTFSSPRDRWVAEADGVVVAWAALVGPEDGVAVLDDLWVDPACMRQRIGSRLFDLAALRARALGASTLEWGAEPNAVGFYEKVGGRYLRDRLTSWGRIVPVMGIEL